jgi:chromate transporter
MENKPTFREAMLYWLKLGFISFGGPAGQIAMMHRELVEKRKWISDEKFSHALNFCMLLPGPEAQQLATYNGWLMHGVKGGIVSGMLFILPSVFVLLAISYIYAKFGDIREVSGVLDGIKAVVVAVVIEAVWKIGKKAFKKNWHIAVAALSFISIYFLHIPFPLIVLCAAIIGLLIPSSAFQTPNLTDTSAIHNPRYIILKTFLACLTLWLIPFLSILFTLGWKSLPMKIYLFFSQAAFVTFGGAYSVLAYVNQYAVTTYGWITAQQAIDGFGLAETTPGPLIMVLQFIGFMAGWNNADGFNPTAYAVLCALLTTFATFLPSFFFIFAFAPIIERFENNEKLKAALSGVTAAVVGVILNLALAFGFAVIYHHNQVNWFAFGLSLTSLIVLFRFKIDVLWIVIGGGILGLLKILLFS